MHHGRASLKVSRPGNNAAVARRVVIFETDQTSGGCTRELGQIRNGRLLLFKMRQKKVYKKTQGHRQYLTELRIKQISLPKI